MKRLTQFIDHTIFKNRFVFPFHCSCSLYINICPFKSFWFDTVCWFQFFFIRTTYQPNSLLDSFRNLRGTCFCNRYSSQIKEGPELIFVNCLFRKNKPVVTVLPPLAFCCKIQSNFVFPMTEPTNQSRASFCPFFAKFPHLITSTWQYKLTLIALFPFN